MLVSLKIIFYRSLNTLNFFFRYKTRGISHQPLDPSYRNLVWMQATLADSFLADLEDLSDNEVLDEVSHCVIILNEDSPGLGFRV